MTTSRFVCRVSCRFDNLNRARRNHTGGSEIMPHCIVEYSEEFEGSVPQLMDAAFHGALESELFEEQDIKTRAIAYRNYRIGRQRARFVHVTARILSGRDQEQKGRLANAILSKLEQCGLSSVSLTVEVCEIERETYAKIVLP
jgi:5-carboxymethyl-2-hydroxymuconate isomerase